MERSKEFSREVKNWDTRNKRAIDSEDYRAETDSLIQAVESAMQAIDENVTKLFTSIVSRMNAAAESDEWFSETASLYANYVATAILVLHGANEVQATGAAYSSVGNGNIVCDVLDASGNVIGSTTARVVSSTTANTSAGAFRTAASNIGNAARSFGSAAANTAGSAARAAVNAPTGVKAAGIAVTGGIVETTRQSSNSNYSTGTTPGQTASSSVTSNSSSYDNAFSQVVNL